MINSRFLLSLPSPPSHGTMSSLRDELHNILRPYGWISKDIDWFLNNPVPETYPMDCGDGKLRKFYWETLLSTLLVAICYAPHLRRYENYEVVRAALRKHELALLYRHYWYINVGNGWSGKVKNLIRGLHDEAGSSEEEGEYNGLDVDEQPRMRECSCGDDQPCICQDNTEYHSDDEDEEDEERMHRARILQAAYYPRLLTPNSDGVWLLRDMVNFDLLVLLITIMRFDIDSGENGIVKIDTPHYDGDRQMICFDGIFSLPRRFLSAKTMSQFFLLTQEIGKVDIGKSLRYTLDTLSLVHSLRFRRMITIEFHEPQGLTYGDVHVPVTLVRE